MVVDLLQRGREEEERELWWELEGKEQGRERKEVRGRENRMTTFTKNYFQAPSSCIHLTAHLPHWCSVPWTES